MTIHSVYRPFLTHFRKTRISLMYRLFRLSGSTRVVDIGGSGEFWRVARELGFPLPRVTIVNLLPPADGEGSLEWVMADGGRLPFANDAFDLAISNSVIEHVGGFAAQSAFGEEVKRVARSVFVQTPDYWCLMEPHFLAPFVHWLPRRWRAGVLPFTPWGLIARPDRGYVERMAAEIRLLDATEMKRIFSGCSIRRGRVLGLPKDLVAIRQG
jgi:hypothetical protein